MLKCSNYQKNRLIRHNILCSFPTSITSSILCVHEKEPIAIKMATTDNLIIFAFIVTQDKVYMILK